MEQEAICWLVLLALFIVIEAATMGLTTIWFAGGAVAAFIVSILGGKVVIQIILFLAVSILLLIFTRPFAAKYINNHKVKTNIDGLIGKRAVITQDVNNLAATGEAQLDGMTWTARTDDDELKIPEGTTVIVQEIRGVRLIVKPEE